MDTLTLIQIYIVITSTTRPPGCHNSYKRGLNRLGGDVVRSWSTSTPLKYLGVDVGFEYIKPQWSRQQDRCSNSDRHKSRRTLHKINENSCYSRRVQHTYKMKPTTILLAFLGVVSAMPAPAQESTDAAAGADRRRRLEITFCRIENFEDCDIIETAEHDECSKSFKLLALFCVLANRQTPFPHRSMTASAPSASTVLISAPSTSESKKHCPQHFITSSDKTVTLAALDAASLMPGLCRRCTRNSGTASARTVALERYGKRRIEGIRYCFVSLDGAEFLYELILI